jgi:hypothetical protein
VPSIMVRTIIEKTAATVTAHDKLELATLIAETFSNDGVSPVFLGCPYKGNERYWLETYLDLVDRALRAGHIFVVEDAGSKVASLAMAFPPGATVDNSKDVNNPHYRYVEDHTPSDQRDFLKEVGLA